VTGYPGADAARDYIVGRLREIGAERITLQQFPVVVPVTKEASVRVGGREVPAYPLWPNGVRTCTTRGTVTGPVIFAGRSAFSDYDGKQVEGSIVLLDGDRSVDWINAPSFGARAVLFIEPQESFRRELEYKVSDMPLATPRFWIPRKAGLRLRRRVEEAEARGEPLEAEISCVVDWERRKGWNILALLPGSDPTQEMHLTMLQTYYDSISVVPDLAPGAESAGNAAALLSLAEAVKAEPARRPVLLVFTAGHFESLAGIRWVCDLLALKFDGLDKEIDRLRTSVIKEEERLADYASIRKLFTAIRKRSPQAYHEAQQTIDLMEKEVLTAPHQRDKYKRLHEILTAFDREPFYISLKTSLDRLESKDRATEGARLKYLRLVAHRELLTRMDPQLPEKVTFAFSLDLSSHSADLGLFHKGNFVDQGGIHLEGVLRRVFADIGLRAADMAKATLPEGAFIDGINQPTGRVWRTYFPAPVAFESELLTVSALPAVVFTTANDARDLVDTPADSAGSVQLDNLTTQVAAVRLLLLGTGGKGNATPGVEGTGDSPREGGFSRGLLNDLRTKLAIDVIRKDELLKPWATRAVGRVVEYDPKRSLGVADVPVSGCVVTCRQNPGPYSRGDVWKSYSGVRPALMELSDGAGNFEFITVPHERSLPWDHRKFLFEAYHPDPDTGEIDFAPDRGDQGEKLFPTDVAMTVAEKDVTIVVFNCVPVAVFDLLDQRSYNMFSTVTLYDARTDSAPFSFGYKVAGKITGTSYIEPVGVLFLSPGMRFKATFGAGIAGTKFALIGATAPDEENYNGIGYLVGSESSDQGGPLAESAAESAPESAPQLAGTQRLGAVGAALINTPYLMARDIWNLDEYRLNVLRTHGVRNDKVEGLHSQARSELRKASAALEELRYGAFVRHSRAAWGYEARAYPSVEGTTTDITTGVLFFLFLLLPVSHFGERLIFGFPDINRQILGFFGIFLVMFLVLALVHPAFGVTSGGPIILLAFITVALSVLVISMIRSRFEVELERLQQRPGQTARADLNRTNAAKQAFLLGIANMRRRKVRTTLTIITLATLMFAVLSLTSIEPKLVVKRRSLAEDVPLPYQGVLIRNVNWGTLTDQVYKGFLNQFVGIAEEEADVTQAPRVAEGTGPIVAPRAWYVSESMKVPTAVDVASTAQPGKRFIASALVGLSPLERFVTHPQEMLITPTAWFTPDQREACVLTEKMAKVLGINPGEVTGRVAGAPRVRVFGEELAVIGIFDDEKLRRYTDIDNEVLSPVDYQEESWQKHSQMRQDPTEV